MLYTYILWIKTNTSSPSSKGSSSSVLYPVNLFSPTWTSIWILFPLNETEDTIPFSAAEGTDISSLFFPICINSGLITALESSPISSNPLRDE